MRFIFSTIFILFFLSSNSLASAKSKEHALKQNQTYNLATSEWAQNIMLSGLIMGEIISSNYDAGSPRRFPTSDSKKYSTFC